MNTSPSPPNVPDHQLIRPIGRGSYGTVWLARNPMGIYRAVKIVQRDSFSDQRPFERELAGIRKFEPISRSHEGFIDVLHVGINEEQGYFYYVMELGDDQELGQQIDPSRYILKTLDKEIVLKQRLAFRECLELGLALSQALAELHKHGLVHRDVKPSNIIFVNGIPKLADIGLVADVNEARSYVGTAGFIPPEGPGTPQADVYSLGKVLYEISTGKDRQDFPELPTLLNEFAERDSFLELNEVILRACKNERKERYQSAWEMHAELLVLANGKSLKRLKILEQRLANVKRLAAAGLIAVVVLVLVAYQVQRQRKAIAEAKVRQETTLGDDAVQSGDVLGALPHFAEALSVKHGGDDTELRARFGSAFAQCPKLVFVGKEDKAVATGAFCPDGENILIAQDWGEAKIYQVRTGKVQLYAFGPKRCLASATYSPQGHFIVTTSEDGMVQVWESTTLKEVCQWTLPQGVLSARMSPDERLVVAACVDGNAWLLNVQTGQRVQKLPHHQAVRFADFSPDGRLIVTCCEDYYARVWDATTGALVGKPLEHDEWVNYANFSHDGQRLITASGDHRAQVWDIKTGRRISPDLIHDDAVSSAVFSPDDRLVMTASLDGTIRLWRTYDFRPDGPNSILRPGYQVTEACFDAEGRQILCTCADGSVRVWDLAGRLLPASIPQSCFSPDGRRLLQFNNNQIQISNTQSNQDIPVMVTTGWPVAKASFNHPGNLILAISQSTSSITSQRVEVFDALTGKALAPEFAPTNSFMGACLSHDGRRLVAFGSHVAQVWDIFSQSPISPPVILPDEISGAFFDAHGSNMVILSKKTIHVCNALNGKDVFPPLLHSQTVQHAEYNPQGTLLLSCCADGSLNPGYAQIWNAANGQPAGPPLKHRDGVSMAVWSPDGRRIATASEDFSAGIWDAATGKRLAMMRHQEKVSAIAFSPDGKWVATASIDWTARVWDAITGNPITPPLWHVQSLAGIQFLGSEHQMASTDSHGHHYIWKIPVDHRPAADTARLARLFAANDEILPKGGSTSMSASWVSLRDAFPSNFVTSREEITAWHEFVAGQCESRRQWFGAAFHLKRLLALHPQDRSLATRLQAAQEQMKSAN